MLDLIPKFIYSPSTFCSLIISEKCGPLSSLVTFLKHFTNHQGTHLKSKDIIGNDAGSKHPHINFHNRLPVSVLTTFLRSSILWPYFI